MCKPHVSPQRMSLVFVAVWMVERLLDMCCGRRAESSRDTGRHAHGVKGFTGIAARAGEHLSEPLSDMLMTLAELWSLSEVRMGRSTGPLPPAEPVLRPFSGTAPAARWPPMLLLNEHNSTCELLCCSSSRHAPVS